MPGCTAYSSGLPRPLYTGFRLDSLRLEAGQSDTLVLRGEFPGGSELLDPARVQWDVEDRRVLQVDRAGEAWGLQPGRTLVDAWTPDVFLASTLIEVQAPPPPPNQLPRFVSAPAPRRKWAASNAASCGPRTPKAPP
ncbi:MAG: hypothetical protein FJY95_11150 [Candidatus Handelsmanbacteria bacterium]|nr:hypothetical protein [Candidatus Handelsmanbacteria bacterium]